MDLSDRNVVFDVEQARFVRWILEKRLQWVGRLGGTAGCRGVLVDIAEVKGLTAKPLLPGLGMRELALALGDIGLDRQRPGTSRASRRKEGGRSAHG